MQSYCAPDYNNPTDPQVFTPAENALYNLYRTEGNRTADELTPNELLQELSKEATKGYDLFIAVRAQRLVRSTQSNLLSQDVNNPDKLEKKDEKRFKVSIVLAINLLRKSKGSLEEFQTAINLLKENAEQRAIGKAGTSWLKLKTSLLALVTAGVFLILCCVKPAAAFITGGILTACTATFYNRNKPKSLSKDLSQFAERAQVKLEEKQRPPLLL
jgi:hypothetical protein